MGLDLTGIGSVADLATTIIGKIWPPGADPNEKIKAQVTLQQLLQDRENVVTEAQKAIIVAEMQQADNFTKRARPMVVYAGLLFIFMIHVAFPMITYYTKATIPTVSLPDSFWWAWTGCVGIWMIGRTVEKSGTAGMAGDIAKMITGSK